MILTQKQLEKMGLDEEPAPKKKGGRYTEHAYPSAGPVRFGARRFREQDGLSTKPAPGPKGPPMSQLQEEAARRRREQREREREGGR